MPKGPNGEKRPSDTIAAAIMVARISVGEIEEELPSKRRNGGLVGGKSRTESMTPEERSELARKAANARWAKQTQEANAGD